MITRPAFFELYERWLHDARRQREDRPDGGSFWNSQNVRVGRRFGAAVIRAVKEGRLVYREAYALTGLKGRTFDEFARLIRTAA